MISLVVAHDEQYAIGNENWMPWNLPEDLKHFKKTTLHGNILMGRTTFEAMKKPLPKRHTYVVTHNAEYAYAHEDVSIVHDLMEIIKQFKEKKETLFICGGAKIYTQALPYVDEMWISLVEGKHKADTFFPMYNPADFILKTKESKTGFTILHYVKK